MRGERCRILLVEDNDADVYLLRKAFEFAGLDVELTVIEDGDEALAFVRAEGGDGRSVPRPHAVMLDLNLPKSEGTDVLEALRANTQFSGVPVIVLTSSPSPLDQHRIAHLRVDRFITKPPDLDEFLKIGKVVGELLRKAKSQAC